MTTTLDPTARYRSTLWTREHRGPTIGLALVVTLIAFEYLGVATALPTIVAGLHGGRFYAWPIAAFTAASAVGTVVAGRICDRRGPAGPVLGGIALFAIGLLIDGLAPNIFVLLGGRVVQGLGAGSVVVAIYLVMAMAYPVRDRPAASALISAAWVVPSLVGPPIAGVVTQEFGWRWVFLGLIPFVLVGLALLAAVLRRLGRSDQSEQADEQHSPVRRGLLLAGVGAAVGVSACTIAAQRIDLASLPIAIAGLVLLVLALRRLLPPGVARAARGVPSVVLCRGLLAGAFGAAEAYLPLTLTSVHHYPPAAAGLPLTAGALGWAASSAWQGRNPDLSRSLLLRIAFTVVAAGLAVVSSVTWAGVPGWLAYLGWIFVGLGMGIGMSSISVLLLAQTPQAERGFNSSAVQLADMLSTVALVGVGGALVNALGSTTRPTVPLFVLDLLMCGLALFGAIVAAGRTDGRLP